MSHEHAIEMPNNNQLHRKRSSVQSNLSSMNGGGGGGGGGSLHSSSSTVTSDEGCNDQTMGGIYSNADYEHIRNSTLLFFLDRLFLASQEGKEARTLHDLSCLFGTKEFTKEMRQIVGASKNGLRRFLQSYPSLFQIDGDKVHLTQLNSSSSGGSTQRDYNREAVDYFKLKLNQFGTSLVPIKNLFGYRSQATQEVRHVSGKNTRDFKRFLRQNSDTFEILADEHVALKSALAELESSGATSLALLEQSLAPLAGEEAIVMDPYLNKQFAHLVEQCIKNMANEEKDKNENFKVTIEQLFERIKRDCQNERLFLKMVKSCEDLKVFLRMYPKLFKRFSMESKQEIKCDQEEEATTTTTKKTIDYVSLLSEDEQRELEAAAVQQHNLMISQRQHSTLSRSMSATTSIPTASAQNLQQNKPTPTTSQLEQQKSRPQVVSQKSQEPRSLPPNTNNNNNNKLASHQLRANAPPFVPNNLNVKPHQRSRNNNREDVMQQRSHSNLSRSTGGNANKPVDQRGAIRNYLLKGAQTTSSNSHNLSWSTAAAAAAPSSLPPFHHQSRRADAQPPTQPQAQSQAQLATVKATTTSADEMRARTVDMVREASNIITRIMTSTDAVAFDCKGYNLGFDGQITLIQFGYLPNNKEPIRHVSEKQGEDSTTTTPSKYVKPEVCVFDLITNPELAYCLKPLLESDKIVKIVHDVRNKSNALHVQFDIILNNVFDTQVANLVVQQQDTGKPAYKSRYISMSKLCEIYGTDELLRYRNLIKFKTRHSNSTTGTNNTSSRSNNATSSSSKDVNYWRTRPLTKPMIFEATMDVYCLVGGIYQNLRSKIKPEYEPLFDQLNLEGVLARIKPEEIRSAKKERKIDLEVIDLKRKLYSDSTGPVVLSNREIRLLRHIDLTDEVRAKIQQCKKVAKKLERLDMKAAQMKSQLEGGDQSTASESMSSINNNNNNNNLDCDTSIDCQSLMASMVSQTNQELNGNADSQNDEIMMSNLMDSSMFDELKDKMIESSSLLESLEDDDDDVVVVGVVEDKLQAMSNHHHHHHHHHHHQDYHGDCQQCKCQCHKSSTSSSSSSNSIADRPKESKAELEKATATTTTTEAEQQTGSQEGAKETSEVVKDENQETSASQEVDNQPELQAGDDSDKSSLACDMAVQCDLLS